MLNRSCPIQFIVFLKNMEKVLDLFCQLGIIE